jgi:hypothetical protein
MRSLLLLSNKAANGIAPDLDDLSHEWYRVTLPLVGPALLAVLNGMLVAGELGAYPFACCPNCAALGVHAYDLAWVNQVLAAGGFGALFRRWIAILYRGASNHFMLHNLSLA